jgi:hypothetical protein
MNGLDEVEGVGDWQRAELQLSIVVGAYEEIDGGDWECVELRLSIVEW